MKRSDKTGLRIGWLLAAAGAIALGGWGFAAAVEQGQKQGYRVASCWWQPYEADSTTLGLFHLDAAKKLDLGKVEKDIAKGLTSDTRDKEDDESVAGELLGGDEKPQGKKTPDSSLHHWEASLTEPAETVAVGHFGGAVRLKGGKAALVSPAYSEIKNSPDPGLGCPSTVECWLCPEASAEAVLFSYDAVVPGSTVLELRQLADGKLSVFCGGKELAKSADPLPAKKWSHVALVVIGRQTPYALPEVPPKIEARVNGKVMLTATGESIDRAVKGKVLSGVVRVGNRAAGDAGFAGLIDEVRVSNEARSFYENDDAWADPEARRKVLAEPPYVRSEKDLLLAVSFDGTLEPNYAAGPVTVSVEGRSKAKMTQGVYKPEPMFVQGVRGKALMVGTGLAMPMYTGSGIVNPARGSFEFWFSPYDWNNRKAQGLFDPMEFVPLFHIDRTGMEDDPDRDLLAFAVFHKKPLNGTVPVQLDPGRWYHAVGTWDGADVRLYINGQPAHPFAGHSAVASLGPLTVCKDLSQAGAGRVTLGPVRTQLNYNDEKTIIDELRIYSRPLTAVEIANMYSRWRSDGKPAPLPFASIEMVTNQAFHFAAIATDILDAKRGQVASVKARLVDPEGKQVAEANMTTPQDGHSAAKFTPVDLIYGKYKLELSFLDAAGKPVGQQTLEQERVRPPWLGSTVGLHEGKVLPGWEAMKASGDTVELWGRKITLGVAGLPSAIVSQGQNILASPMRVAAKVGGKDVELAAQGGVKIEKAADDAVVTSGAASGGGLNVASKITTEFDGLMKVELTLSGSADVDSLTVEIPLNARNANLLAYWTGNPNFRGATWYGQTPEKPGVVLDSNEFTKGKPRKGTFMPYVFLGDDWRGLAWFAENDKGWTINENVAAVQAVRDEKTVTLRLNILTEKTNLTEPRTIVFGLQPSPVRAMDSNHRSRDLPLSCNLVDSFSFDGFDLKSEGDSGSFDIYPFAYDWDAAAQRLQRGKPRFNQSGYDKAILYIDRNWVGLPPDCEEYRGRWFASGFFRYLPEAINCHLWHMDQWIKHKLIAGVYIDDVWLGSCTDVQTGPAYLLADGNTVQPGYEFFDFHQYLKRLRWVFVDNGLEPMIWIHMTKTLFIPTLAFADCMYNGEDYYPNWGSPNDFIDSWGVDNIRLNNGLKWGPFPRWMYNIGNNQKVDRATREGMKGWEYHQVRSYYADTLLHDVVNDKMEFPFRAVENIDCNTAGCFSDDAEFLAYYDPNCPVRSDSNGILASVYRLKDRSAIVVVNRSKQPIEAILKLDPAGLAGAAKAEDLAVADCDHSDPPKGEDISKLTAPKSPDEVKEDKDDVDNMISEALDEAKVKQLKAKGVDVLDRHNFVLKGDTVKLLVGSHDYRLLVVTKK